MFFALVRNYKHKWTVKLICEPKNSFILQTTPYTYIGNTDILGLEWHHFVVSANTAFNDVLVFSLTSSAGTGCEC